MFRIRAAVLAVVPLLALALGGATQPLAAGVVVALMGWILMAMSPKMRACPRLAAGSIFIWLWCATALLPASLFAPELWRSTVEGLVGRPLSPVYSAQPWITLEAWLYLGAVLLWLNALAAQGLDEKERGLMLRLYLLGIGMLAIGGLACHIAGIVPPFWGGNQPGPFPNRNQSANVLALAGVAGFALGMRQLHHGKKHGVVWLAVTLVFVGFLAALGSRAGLLVFFLGAAGWLMWDLRGSRKKSRVMVGVTVGLLLLAGVLLLGGRSVERVLQVVEGRTEWKQETRLVLQRDAVDLAADQPVLGVGLGNFDGVFGMYRDRYQSWNRPIHPESDWVWWLCEAGVPGLVGVLFLVLLVLRKAWPGHADQDRRLRRAAWIILVLFALHALVDVPAHRLGSALALLFFIPLALPGGVWVEPGRVQRLAFGLGGAAVLLFGLLQITAATGRLDWPGAAKVARLHAAALDHDMNSHHAEALELALTGQKLSPLDWRFYYQEGFSRLGLNMGWHQASRAFRLVRVLEPDSPFVPFQIGQAWLGREASHVLSAWREALRRKDFQRPAFFRDMRRLAARDPEVMAGLHTLAQSFPELDLYLIAQVSDQVLDGHLARVLARAPEDYGLEDGALEPFFNDWRTRRGNVRFLEEISRKPMWLRAGWWSVAQAQAETGRIHQALETLERHLLPVPLPRFDFDEARAREIVRRHPDDIPAGLFLFQQAFQQGNWPAARKRLDPLLALPDKPAYLHRLDADLQLKEGHDSQAWAAMKRYVESLEKR